MAKNTSIVLGDHFEQFINRQISSGRYGSASEVIRASLRLLEEHERHMAALHNAMIEDKRSELAELAMKESKRKARRRAKSGN